MHVLHIHEGGHTRLIVPAILLILQFCVYVVCRSGLYLIPSLYVFFTPANHLNNQTPRLIKCELDNSIYN